MADKDDGETGIRWHLEQAPSRPARPNALKSSAQDLSFRIMDVSPPASSGSPSPPSAMQPEFPNGPVDRRSGPVSPFLPPTAGAERQQRHRRRKQAGLVPVVIELKKDEIADLVQKGLLAPEMQNNRTAIANAIYDFLEEGFSK